MEAVSAPDINFYRDASMARASGIKELPSSAHKRRVMLIRTTCLSIDCYVL